MEILSLKSALRRPPLLPSSFHIRCGSREAIFTPRILLLLVEHCSKLDRRMVYVILVGESFHWVTHVISRSTTTAATATSTIK